MTALLWLMLGAIVRLERRVADYFRRKTGVLPHFFEVVAIVLTLMAAEALLSWTHRRLAVHPSG